MSQTRELRLVRNFVGYAAVPARIHEEAGAADGMLSTAFRTAAEEKLARVGVPGAQIAVLREGELLWSACAGRLRRTSREDFNSANSPEKVRRGDRFVIASATKLVIACVTLSLAERGELDLDDPTARWLPDLPNASRITVRLLLGHRSGLSEYFKDEWVLKKLKDEPLQSWDRWELLEAVVRLGSEQEPDQRFAYRNTNYIAIGEILESCTGKSIGNLVEEHVSRPLGLRTLSFAEDSSGVGRLAAPYIRRFGRVLDPLERTGGQVPSDAMGEVWTDGGIAASAEDLATLTDALFRGELLRPETVEDMTVRSAAPGSAVGGFLGLLQKIYLGAGESAYGLGVAIEERGETRTLGHEGMYLGWSATTTFDTRSGVTVTVLTNLSNIPVPADRLQRAIHLVLKR